MLYCKVKFCRFSGTHTTAGHKCGLCHQYGHGRYECGKLHLIEKLNTYINEELPTYMYCKRPKCEHYKFHTTETHQCKYCNEFHSGYNCVSNPEFQNRLQNEIDHPSTYRYVPIVEDFDDTQIDIDCPTCRKNAKINSNKNRVYGLDNECIVCCKNKVNIFLPCGHVNLCLDCVKALSKKYVPDPFEFEFIRPDSTYDELNAHFIERFAGRDGKIYHVANRGMGTEWFMRRNGTGELIEIHYSDLSDVYDQNHANTTVKFIEGYTRV